MAAATTSDDILSLLTPQRRQELLGEVLGGELRNIVAAHQGGTFGALVEALTGHSLWNHLRELAVSSLFRPVSGAVAKAPAAAPKAAPAAAAPKAKAPPKAAKPKAKAKGKKAKKVKGGADLDVLLAYITKNPGQRAELIRKAVGGVPEAVTAGLASLHEAGKVKRAGKARGTTYTAA